MWAWLAAAGLISTGVGLKWGLPYALIAGGVLLLIDLLT